MFSLKLNLKLELVSLNFLMRFRKGSTFKLSWFDKLSINSSIIIEFLLLSKNTLASGAWYANLGLEITDFGKYLINA